MKKVFCFLLIAAMLITSAFTAFSVAAGEAFFTFEDAAQVGSMVFFDGKLIATDDSTNYVVLDPSAGAETVKHSFTELIPTDNYWYYNNFLIPADNGLYMIFCGIDIENSEDARVVLKKLELDGDTLIEVEEFVLDWQLIFDTFGNYAMQSIPENPCIAGGYLVCNFTSLEGESYIAAFDIVTGECRIERSDLVVMCSYRDAKVLAYTCDHGNAEAPVIIYSFAPFDNSATALCAVPGRNYYGCSYADFSRTDNALYFVIDATLYSLSGMDSRTLTEICPIRIDSNYTAKSAAIGDGRYATTFGASIYIYDSETAGFEGSLTINSTRDSFASTEAANSAFAEEHPNISIAGCSDNRSIQTLLKAQDPAADIYIVNVASSDYRAVMENDHLIPLEGNEVIGAAVGAMYPWVSDYVTRDDHVVGIPVEIYSATDFAYYPYAFEALGLTEDDIPETWPEFLQLLAGLPEMLAENGNITAFPTKYAWKDVRDYVFTSMINSYILYADSKGMEVSFDDPVLRELIAEFEKIDFSALGMPETGEYRIYNADEVLFSYSFSIDPYIYASEENTSEIALPLSFSAESEAFIPAELYIAFVNPYSGNGELAVDYLANVVEAYPETMKISIWPEYDEPILNEQFAAEMSAYDDQEAEVMAKMETATEAEMPALQKELDDINAQRDEYLSFMAPYAYDVGPENIAAYRGYTENFLVITDCGIEDGNRHLITELCVDYLNGELTADEFIIAADSILNLMILVAE